MVKMEPRPSPQNKMISVSGVLRRMLTYSVPTARRTGKGATRIAASTVPRTSDPTALSADSFSVIQKASRIVWPSLCRKLIMAFRSVRAAAGGARAGSPAHSCDVISAVHCCWNGMLNWPMVGGVPAGTWGRFWLRAVFQLPSLNMSCSALSTASTPFLSPFLMPTP